jgi:TolB-like protein/DNA-binding winged helix-turn-helix (wHTH) protein/Tfp pilus assembly protein PilF
LNLLIFLVESRGRLVTRRELIDSVWNGAFVTDHVLNRAIGQLRKCLPDDPKEPRYIETVPTLGYRFIGKVEDEASAYIEKEHPAGSESHGLSALQTQLQQARDFVPVVPPPRTIRPAWLTPRIAIWLALVLAVGAGVAWTAVRWRDAASAGRIRSLVVLPLDNLSGDAAQQYVADGMTDELITDLGRIGALRVISRTTAMQYRNAKKSLPQIAGELHVDAVIEGSVLRSGERVRIAAQLVSAATERQLWAQSYEGDAHDVIGLQNRVAGAVADQVRIKLTPSEQSILAETHQVNLQAYEALLKGNYFFRRNTTETAQKSLQYFQQALKLDPNFARAYVGVARSYNFLGEDTVPAGEATAAADAALAKALQLEPDLAEAYAERGWTLLFYHWDFPGAERDFRRALELEPSSSDAHGGYAHYLLASGRFVDAIEQMQQARDLDPLSPFTLTENCTLLFMARRYAEAEAQCAAALELDPNYPWALSLIADVYEMEGKYDESHKITARIYQCDPTCADGVDEAFGRSGKSGKFDAWMHPSADQEAKNTFSLAMLYAGAGHKDKAFALIEHAYTQRRAMHEFAFLAVDPRFDKLRSDPRFDAFLRRAGLPPQPRDLLTQTKYSLPNPH